MNPLVKCPTGDSNVVNAGGEKFSLPEGEKPTLPEVDSSELFVLKRGLLG